MHIKERLSYWENSPKRKQLKKKLKDVGFFCLWRGATGLLINRKISFRLKLGKLNQTFKEVENVQLRKTRPKDLIIHIIYNKLHMNITNQLTIDKCKKILCKHLVI